MGFDFANLTRRMLLTDENQMNSRQLTQLARFGRIDGGGNPRSIRPMFVSISEAITDLQWLRDPRSSRTHLLSCHEGLVGTLSFQGLCGSLAKGETAHGSWTFKREGFLHPRVSIRREGSDVAIGILSLSRSGAGTLLLSGSGEYRFTSTCWWPNRWSFEKGSQNVVRFERTRGGSTVTIEKTATEMEALSLFCLLGWYMPLLADSDAAALAASMAAIVACY